MRQMVEGGPRRTLAVAEPAENLEAQLAASIRTPPVGRMVRTALLTLGLSLVPLADGWAVRRFVIASRPAPLLSASARLMAAHLQAAGQG